MDDTKNIFVIGLNDFNRQRLETLRGVEHYRFHGVIAPEAVYDTEEFDIAAMLEEATAQLEAFEGSIDAIVGYMDFPVSTMLPILCERFGTRSTSLESLLKCEHKYWSRRVQREVIPEFIPAFTAFDPFDDEALTQIGAAGLYFPFFVKPIKSSGSRLGFRIDTPEDFYQAIEQLRGSIGMIADPFNTVLEHARLPPEVAAVDGHFCMAEEIIGGWQCTIEGYVHNGQVVSYGIVDSLRYPQVLSFFHYRYPSGLPDPIQDKMVELTDTVMRHIGYDNAAFNVEYFWDEVQDRIWLLEINTRISQSHCDLFEKVDGVSNQQVTIDLGLGHRPDMPSRQGDFPMAAKFFYRVFFSDAVVTRIPSPEEVAELESAFPGTVIAIQVEVGQQLSTLPEQDSYSYALAYIWMGAEDSDTLLANYERLVAQLQFEFADIVS
ncbi:ATP-grasp domain-containing protein [Halomonas korlensis]|uniref:Biotin carboxylase n=1 Tax=Halomonas korlensis TaxID=463301 RepID=A0A1I7I4H5_9GAMM|nr:ATP-grasp domain-containing protein [Halomonas korlensis]SFU67837.1 Biotin carboxylase [Halomonas korlensis]